jgi:putative aldouronate transport system permease protein
MPKRKSAIKTGSPIVTAIFYILSFIVCLITLYPMYYVFILSISNPKYVMSNQVFFYPKGLYLGSYKIIVSDMKMWRAYLNTIFYVCCGTILMVMSSILCAYPLISKKLKYRKWVVRFLLVPMYFSGGMIPSFLLINKLGLYNTRMAIILPGAVGIMNIILVRTFFATIPESLSESAFIDGANHYRVLFNIYVPLSKPVLAVISIYTIVNIWNSWFSAMIYLPSEKLHPLQMYLQRILVAQTVDLTKLHTMEDVEAAISQRLTSTQLKYSMIIFITLPILFTYPFFQKYFIKGIMLGSLKG